MKNALTKEDAVELLHELTTPQWRRAHSVRGGETLSAWAKRMERKSGLARLVILVLSWDQDYKQRHIADIGWEIDGRPEHTA